MFKYHFSTKKEESDSESKALSVGWKKDINLVQQMFIAQQYRTDNGMDSDEEVKYIDNDQLKCLRKKAKKAKKCRKRS